MNNRIEKVNSLLEQEISKIILRDFYFPGVLVTLTHVDSSANLIEAKVYVSVFPDEKIDKIIETLSKGAYSVQQKINKLLKMRPVPKIKFVRDKELIKHVAELARLELTEEEIKKFTPQLKETLEFFSKLQEVKTDIIKPSFQPVEIRNSMREDKEKSCLSQEEALSLAKNKKDGYFKGPKVV